MSLSADRFFDVAQSFDKASLQSFVSFVYMSFVTELRLHIFVAELRLQSFVTELRLQSFRLQN
jgi:hypothetical protein